MNTGQIISGAGHVGLIGWAFLAGVFTSEPLPFEVTEVTAISAEDYNAILAAQRAPETATDLVLPEPPQAEDSTPDLGSATDQSPEQAQPEAAGAADPDALPDVIEPEPPADTQVTDEVPELTQPRDDVAVLVPEISTRPQERPANRVAPEPMAQPEPDVRIDDITQPETVPDEAPAEPQPETEATAQEEAATEIVTEAEEPARAAPSNSLRPKSRPQRQAATEPKKTTAPEANTQSAIEAALAEAGGGAEDPAPSAPSGPPLTRGEKDALRVAVQKCWNVGSLSSEALQTTVTIAVSMREDGKPIAGTIRQLSASGGSGGAAKQAYEAARRAIIRCGARGYDLPRDKYDRWRDIEITFNPEKMRIK